MVNEIQLRDVLDSDLPVFFEQQLDPEATQMAGFPSRTWEAFMSHWQRVMADDAIVIKTILFQGESRERCLLFSAWRTRSGILAGKRILGQRHCHPGSHRISNAD